MRETRGFGWRGVTFCMANVLLAHTVQNHFAILALVLGRSVVGYQGETYVSRIDANGNAGLLLDFLRHRGGVVDRWTLP